MNPDWLGNPYYPISRLYRNLFGERVYKVPVSVVDDCPNRRGLKGMQTCVFCDVWGSAARSEAMTLPLKEQIEKYKDYIGSRFKAKAFLVYFQAYTNTFTKVSQLRENFDLALSYEDVKGLVVGTRPDCLSAAVLDLWTEAHERSFVSVELGVQSFNDRHLEFMRRGHTAEQSLKAIDRISKNSPVDLGIHLIFGSPGETNREIVELAKQVSDLPISNVKIHNLHVLENTPLAQQYRAGEFQPIELKEYTERVALFLTHLDPRIAVHRLAALASRWDELIAPDWTKDKMGTHQHIVDYLKQNHLFQGQQLLESETDLWKAIPKELQSSPEPLQA